MKKSGKALLCAALMTAVIPFSAPAPVSAGSCVTQVIGARGSRTYMGTFDAWSAKKWNSDDFTDVTGEDVDYSGPLMIRGGTVGKVTLSGDLADLTVYGGSTADIQCDGSIDILGGNTGSLSSQEDISIRNAAIRGDVKAHDTVSLTGQASVSGDVSGNDVSVYAMEGSGSVSVSGTAAFADLMTLTGPNHSFGGLDGQSFGTLKISGFAGTLPPVSNADEISMAPGSAASVSGSLSLRALILAEGSDLAVPSGLSVGTLTGPGAVTVRPGGLTVNSGTVNSPVIDFNGAGADGVSAFSAKSGSVSADSILSFGYGFIRNSSSNGLSDSFTLKALSGNGVSLSASAAVLPAGKSVSVKAFVTPGLSQMPKGTQLCWKLMDPYSVFDVTPNVSDASCSIRLQDFRNTKTAAKADLAVYLADSYGNPLRNCRSALCTVSVSG